MFKKGEIYLARLNPRKGNEVGKVRPIFIYQRDMLNDVEHNIIKNLIPYPQKHPQTDTPNSIRFFLKSSSLQIHL